METYNLSDAMNWEQFKALPTDLQEEYIAGIVRRYDAGLNMAANDLFRVSNATLSIHLKRHGLAWPKTEHGCKRPSEAVMNTWLNFCGLDNTNVEPTEPDVSTCDKGEETPVKPERHFPVAEMIRGSITLKGSAQDVASRLVTLLGVTDQWTIRIEFEKEQGHVER